VDGFTFKQAPMSSSRFLLKWSGIGLYSPFVTLFYKSFMFLATKGGLRAVNSYMTHPSDQISHLGVYALLVQTSGGQ
jgi:hypothetical protein